MPNEEEMDFDKPFIEGGKYVGEDGERRLTLWTNVVHATIGNLRALQPESLRAEVKDMTLEERLARAKRYIHDNISAQEASAMLKSRGLSGGPLNSAPGTEELRTLLEERVAEFLGA